MSDKQEMTLIPEKPCCSICDTKKRCHICKGVTLYACADCAIDLGVTVYVCPTRACRDAHERKCSACLRALKQPRITRAQVRAIMFPSGLPERSADLVHAIDKSIARLRELGINVEGE